VASLQKTGETSVFGTTPRQRLGNIEQMLMLRASITANRIKKVGKFTKKTRKIKFHIVREWCVVVVEIQASRTDGPFPALRLQYKSESQCFQVCGRTFSHLDGEATRRDGDLSRSDYHGVRHRVHAGIF
jgi:hypothetical protein